MRVAGRRADKPSSGRHPDGRRARALFLPLIAAVLLARRFNLDGLPFTGSAQPSLIRFGVTLLLSGDRTNLLAISRDPCTVPRSTFDVLDWLQVRSLAEGERVKMELFRG